MRRPPGRSASTGSVDRAVDALLGEVGLGGRPRIVGLHIGAAFGPSKLWPAESFARLAAQLAAADLAPLLLGSPADRETADAVIAASRRAPASLVGRDRPALLPRLFSRLQCLVSGDTGVAHLAAAVGVPTVTLFGPTDPRLTAPRGAAARVRLASHRLRALLSRRMSHRAWLSSRHRGGRRRAAGAARRRGMRTVLHTESSPGLGGQEIRTLNEARWIGERGWRVIVAGQPEGRFVTRAREAGLETAPLRMRSPWDLSAVARLTRLIRGEGVSVVHTHSSVDGWLGGLAARAARVPVVRTRHVSIPVRRGFNPVYTWLADRVITSGEAIRRIIVGAGVPAGRVVAIPAGVDLETLPFRTGPSAGAPASGPAPVVARDRLRRDVPRVEGPRASARGICRGAGRSSDGHAPARG